LQLEGYNLERPLPLPVDRHRSSIYQRSGFASIAEIYFDDKILSAFLTYASSHEVTPFQLGLAIFYIFLFKLTHGQNDLCISCFSGNRYRTELQNMNGMFVATLPYRLQLDPHWSFDELVKHVREKTSSILEHSHYPLQHILADCHIKESNIEFLETAFDFITISSNIDQLSFDEAILGQVSLQQSFRMTKFDFFLIFFHNSALDNGRLSCRFVCSRDLFDEATVATIARRFQHFLFQLFASISSLSQIDLYQTPINKLTVILPEEDAEMEGVLFCRQTNIINEGMSFTIYNV
jgi:non-ribosomal peptide synthetase component F